MISPINARKARCQMPVNKAPYSHNHLPRFENRQFTKAKPSLLASKRSLLFGGALCILLASTYFCGLVLSQCGSIGLVMGIIKTPPQLLQPASLPPPLQLQ